MIKDIYIKYDNPTTPYRFKHVVEDTNNGEKRKLLPEHIEFSEGLNIIVGANGCGKSTLLNLLTHGCLIYGLKADFNFWDAVAFFFPNAHGLGNDKFNAVQNLVWINNNFNVPVKRMDSLAVKKQRSGGEFKHAEDFLQFFQEKDLSEGQRMMNTIFQEIMRAQKEFQSYRFEKLFLPENSANEIWMAGNNKVKEYLDNFHDETLPRKSTYLMDEPDKGLDVFNLKELKSFFEHASESCQLITVLHNPLLIKSLADKANIIELTPNYMEAIKSF